MGREGPADDTVRRDHRDGSRSGGHVGRIEEDDMVRPKASDGSGDGLGNRARNEDLDIRQMEPPELASREDAKTIMDLELVPDPDDCDPSGTPNTLVQFLL